MKKNYFLLIALCAGMFAQAQTSFTLLTPATVDGWCDPQGYIELDVEFKSSDANDITLSWEAKSNTLSNDWTISLCDLGNCYFDIPSGENTMETATAKDKAFLKLTIFPAGNVATGSATFDVYNANDPNDKVSVGFDVSVTPTGMIEYNLQPITFYPNPVKDVLHLTVNDPSLETVAIYNMLGAKVKEVNLTAGVENTKVDLSSLNSGLYFIQYQHQGEAHTRKLIVE